MLHPQNPPQLSWGLCPSKVALPYFTKALPLLLGALPHLQSCSTSYTKLSPHGGFLPVVHLPQPHNPVAHHSRFPSAPHSHSSLGLCTTKGPLPHTGFCSHKCFCYTPQCTPPSLWHPTAVALLGPTPPKELHSIQRQSTILNHTPMASLPYQISPY